jgi:hypothetical protein
MLLARQFMSYSFNYLFHPRQERGIEFAIGIKKPNCDTRCCLPIVFELFHIVRYDFAHIMASVFAATTKWAAMKQKNFRTSPEKSSSYRPTDP